jgi:hypothetical protein
MDISCLYDKSYGMYTRMGARLVPTSMSPCIGLWFTTALEALPFSTASIQPFPMSVFADLISGCCLTLHCQMPVQVSERKEPDGMVTGPVVRLII